MRGTAVAARVLGARDDARVAVIVAQVPRRAGFNRLATTNAVDAASSDERYESLASVPVKRLPVLPVPQPLASLRGHCSRGSDFARRVVFCCAACNSSSARSAWCCVNSSNASRMRRSSATTRPRRSSPFTTPGSLNPSPSRSPRSRRSAFLYVSERSSAGRISAPYSSSRSVAAKPPFKPNCGFTPALFRVSPWAPAMTADSAKYGRDWKIQRKRVQRQIVAGRGVCELCGWAIRSDDHWSLSREAGGAIHSRCGFDQGLLGKARTA